MPFGHEIPPFGGAWDDGAARSKAGPVMGYARQSAAKHRVAGLGRHRRYNRRAESHGYPSLTARQSRDLLLISGRVDFVSTPAPLASPRSPPKEGYSITPIWRGQRGCCSGSFLPSLRSVRRSPSAPRKCQMAHLRWIKSVSANDPENYSALKAGRWLKLPRHKNCCIAKNLVSLWASSRARRVDYSP